MVTTLGKACILKSGKFIAAKEIHEQYADGLFPCFGGNGIRGYVAEYSHDGTYPLIGRQGALCGNVNYANGKFRATEHAVVVQPVEEIDTRWLYYKLTAMNLGQYATGAAQPGLAVSKLEQLPLTIPSYEAQKQTAKMFDLVEHLITLRKGQLAKLDQLVKSRFVEMFGDPISNTNRWKIEKAEGHIDLLSGFPFDSTQYADFGIKICGGLIIMPQRIDWDSCKYWSSTEGFEEYALEENDIVMALDRPWISEGFKIAMVEADKLPALLIQRTARIRALDINQHYLMHCFLLGEFDNHCNVTGSLVPHISAKDIRSFPIMLPPMGLQEQFASFVEQTDKTKLTIQSSLEKLEVLKKSLMQEYFN